MPPNRPCRRPPTHPSLARGDVEPGKRRRQARSATPAQPGAARIARGVAGRRCTSVAPDPARGRPLIPLLDEDAQLLDEAYHFLSAATRTAQPVPSEDWLRDNHHVVQDQVREVRQDLPRKFYFELPKLADGRVRRLPARLRAGARSGDAHRRRFDLETLIDFVSAYQRGVAARDRRDPGRSRSCCGSRWSRSCGGSPTACSSARRNREKARRWACASPRPAPARNGSSTTCCATPRARASRLPPAFVVELLQWLRDQPSTAAPAWQAPAPRPRGAGRLARRAAAPRAPARSHRSARHRQRHHDACGCCRRSTGRSSSSASASSSGSCSEDPAGAYARMDFPTRDRYRHSVEQLAQRSREPETGSGAARGRARARADARSDPAERSPPSRRLLPDLARPLPARSRISAIRRAAGERLARFVFRHPALGYLGTIAADASRSASRSLLVVRGAARRDLARAAGWSPLVALHPGQRAGDQPVQPADHLARSRRASCRSSTCASGIPGRRSHDGRRPGDHRLRARASRRCCRRPRGALPRQPRSRTCTSRCSSDFPDAAERDRAGGRRPLLARPRRRHRSA